MRISPPADLFSSPDLYPARIDLRKRLVAFVRMSRETYAHSSFLDERMWRVSAEEYRIDIDDLLGCATASVNRVNYVLHTAFCCSTLLARYLELIPSCFVLKEPALLTQLAVAMPALSEPERVRLLRLCVRLLGRAWGANETVIIKAADGCSPLGGLLLESDSRSRIVFLSIALRTFVLSVLKSADRRLWLRKRLGAAAAAASLLPRLGEIDPEELTDARGSAYLWLVNETFRERFSEGQEASRVISLDGETVAGAPGDALLEVARHLEISIDGTQVAPILKHDSVHRYSKNRSVPYDANSRREDMAAAEMNFGAEADTGIQWANSVAGLRRPIPETADLSGNRQVHLTSGI